MDGFESSMTGAPTESGAKWASNDPWKVGGVAAENRKHESGQREGARHAFVPLRRESGRGHERGAGGVEGGVGGLVEGDRGGQQRSFKVVSSREIRGGGSGGGRDGRRVRGRIILGGRRSQQVKWRGGEQGKNCVLTFHLSKNEDQSA